MLAGTLVAACGGGGGGGGGTPPTTAPTSTPSGSFNQADFTCPTSDSAAAVARVAPSGETSIRAIARGQRGAYSSNLLAVSYGLGFERSSAQAIATREAMLGVRMTHELQFDRLGTATRIVSVDPYRMGQTEASLRAQPGVRSVSRVGMRYVSTVSAPYFGPPASLDPYFTGFKTTVAGGPSNSPQPPTYEIPPFEEGQYVPGEWDMHAIRVEDAFAYSQVADAPAGFQRSGAVGNPGVKIAMIDTGQDTTHPELHSKIVYQKCFITNPNGAQSVSNFTNDPQGHGTDTAGIAGEDFGNGLGFAGAGGNVSLMGYRVFPTPDTDNCDTAPSTDQTCGSDTADIAAAINDAVAHGANVISMSLGGTDSAGNGCSNGQDVDPTEGAAVSNAVAHNVVIAAASGNGIGSGEKPGQLDAPACDSGVIAVGATGLDDGMPNGAGAGGNAGGTKTNPKQYVASYSQYGSPFASYRSPSAWGIVAPGGDPNSTTDVGNTPDDYHWIENIWTSTPLDKSYSGTCLGDYPGESATVGIDCREDIAGTSMSTPHVAGVAALIISAAPGYQIPTRMKQLLCSTADQVTTPKSQGEGCGGLDAYRAMATAVGDPNLP